MKRTYSHMLVLILAIGIFAAMYINHLNQESGRSGYTPSTSQIVEKNAGAPGANLVVENTGSIPSDTESLDKNKISDKLVWRQRSEYVRLLVSPPEFSYSRAKDELTAADLSILYDVLDDLDEYESWGSAATAIGALGENDESYRVILDYIKRPQQFSELANHAEFDESQLTNFLMDKILALRWLPFLSRKEGTELLQTILSNGDSAESFLEYWNKDEIPNGFGDIRRAATQLRVAAAMGLIFRGGEENVIVVRKQFDAINKLVNDIPGPNEPQVSEDEMLANGRLLILQSNLVEALAIAGYIEQHSAEEYLIESGSAEVRTEIRSRAAEIIDRYGLYD